MTMKSLNITELNNFDLELSAHTYLKERAKALFLSIQYVIDSMVEGDVAEFGVLQGDSAIVLATSIRFFEDYSSIKNRLLKNEFPKKYLHLYDSFEGYPELENDVDLNSHERETGLYFKGGHGPADKNKQIFANSASLNSRECLGEDRVKVHIGYFSDLEHTENESPQKLSLVHFDCDMYQSTYDALDYIFENNLMSDGSVLMFDGWALSKSSNKFGMRRAWREINEKYEIDSEDRGEFAVMCQKFIIHK